jgi:hypothetical protein
MLKISPTPNNAHKDTSDSGLSHTFLGPGGCEFSERPQNALVKGLFIFSCNWITRTLSLPTVKKHEELSQANVGAVHKYRLPTCIFFILSCEELTPDICPSILGTPCIFLMLGTTFHTHTKEQTKFYFSLSQHLHPWIAKCRHQIYNLLISRIQRSFFFSYFLSCWRSSAMI